MGFQLHSLAKLEEYLLNPVAESLETPWSVSGRGARCVWLCAPDITREIWNVVCVYDDINIKLLEICNQ